MSESIESKTLQESLDEARKNIKELERKIEQSKPERKHQEIIRTFKDDNEGLNYIGKQCSVTDRQFKTRRRTYLISKIEKTEIKRNFLIFLPMFALSFLFTFKFWKFLYNGEIFLLLIFSIVGSIFSFMFGTLQVYSKALGEPALFGFIPTLKHIRNSIDNSMIKMDRARELKEENMYE